MQLHLIKKVKLKKEILIHGLQNSVVPLEEVEFFILEIVE